jgi:hypothetical protein
MSTPAARTRTDGWLRLAARAARASILVLVAVAALSLARRDDKEEIEQWADLEALVDTTGFSHSFIDSLARHKAVDAGRSLRTIEQHVPVAAEKVVLEASWGPFKAGYGILTTSPDPARGQLRLSVKAVTTRFISALFKVRDYLQSSVDMQGLYPVFHQEHIREGRYRAKRWALFDHAGGVVHSSKKRYRRVEAEPFVHTLLTLLYHVRNMRLAPGDTFTVACYVQGKVYPVFFNCRRKDLVKTKAGDFECVELEPVLTGTGRNFSRRDRVRLWLTDDERHMLVKVRSKLKVGAVNAELVHYEVGLPVDGASAGESEPQQVHDAE